MKYEVRKSYLGKPHPIKHVLSKYVQSPLKISFIKNYVELDDVNLLDFGSGSGSFGGYIKENLKGIKINLYDPSKPSLKRAKGLFNFNNSELFYDVDSIPNAYYDIITAWSVYAYVPNKKEFWTIISKKMKKEGLLFVLVDNHKSIYNRFTNSDFGKWDIDLDKVPKELKLISKKASPMPSHYYHYLLNPSKVYHLKKMFIVIAEKLLRSPPQLIYVFKKISQ